MQDEQVRMQGCIDNCEKEIAAIKTELARIQLEYHDQIAQIVTRLSVLESVVIGNGRPGLMDLLSKQGVVLDGINDRLSKVEHTNDSVRTRQTDNFTRIGLWIAGTGVLASIVYNIVTGLV